MNRSMRCAAALLASLATAAVQAADFRAGASVGRATWKTRLLPGFDMDRRHTAGKLFAGWQFMPNLGAEIGYVHLGRADITGPVIPGVVRLRGDGLFVDLVGTLPIADRVALHARAGAFYGRTRLDPPLGSASDKGTRWKAGVGAEFALNPRFGLRVEWERYRFDAFADKIDFDLVSAGVIARF